MTNMVDTNMFLYSPPKTGSTALYRILQQHPQLCASRIKEPNFFARFYEEMTIDEYNDFFQCSDTQNPKIKYEGSSTYFSHNLALDRILKCCRSNTKFITILRNPIDRMISQYIHFRTQYELQHNQQLQDKFLSSISTEWRDGWLFQSQFFQGVPNCIDKILQEKRRHHLIYWSLYPEHIINMQNKIDSQNMMFIIYEDYKNMNQQYCKQMFKFLNIEDISSNISYYKDNRSDFWKTYFDSRQEITYEHIDELSSYFRPYIEHTEELLKISTGWLD